MLTPPFSVAVLPRRRPAGRAHCAAPESGRPRPVLRITSDKRPPRLMGCLPGCLKRLRTATVHDVIVRLAVVLWLVIVAWSLALMRAAGTTEMPALRPPDR